MSEDKQFNFKICDELRRLCEDGAPVGALTNLSYIRFSVNYCVKKRNQLSKDNLFHILIHMITYSSMGDMDKAIGNLHQTK